MGPSLGVAEGMPVGGEEGAPLGEQLYIAMNIRSSTPAHLNRSTDPPGFSLSTTSILFSKAPEKTARGMVKSRVCFTSPPVKATDCLVQSMPCTVPLGRAWAAKMSMSIMMSLIVTKNTSPSVQLPPIWYNIKFMVTVFAITSSGPDDRGIM